MKEEYVINWVLNKWLSDGPPFNVVNNVVYYVQRFIMYGIGDIKIPAQLKLKWFSQCILDLFGMLSTANVTIEKSKLQELRMGDVYELILDLAFMNFANEYTEDYENLIQILALDIMHHRLNLIVIVKFTSEGSTTDILNEFKRESILMLKSIRSDWSVVRRRIIYPYLLYYYPEDITFLLY